MKRVLLLSLTAGLLVLFCSLGSWQLERRTWKLQLINQVDRQLQNPPAKAPGPTEWDALNAEDSYRPVMVRGRFLHQQEALVQAMTVLGSGYWILTPLETDTGFTVLVNRGFVDQPHSERQSRPSKGNDPDQPIEVHGLLRMSEPDGRMLQANQPEADRWYSRDVKAIGALRGLPENMLAPYFIDANAPSTNEPTEWPVGGLTVVTFRNTHLVYAITWYALALLCAIGAVLIVRAK